MSKKSTPTAETPIPAADIRRLCGDIPDWKVAAIAALAPARSDVELAVMWADHQDEARQERGLEVNAARIFDILTADEEEEDDRR